MKKRQIVLICLSIVIAPLAIMVAISLADYYANIVNFWVNPQGIGNAEIFLFSASYIAGICTLIAFLFTIAHNKKSQDAAFDENKKQLAYQSALQAITEEKHALSNVILGLHVRKLRDILVDYLNVAISSEQRLNNVQDLLSSLTLSMNTLAESQARLTFETDIKDSDCEQCKNLQSCTLGEIKINFRNKYIKIFEALGTTFSDTYEYISINTINIKSKLEETSLEAQKGVVLIKLENIKNNVAQLEALPLGSSLANPNELSDKHNLKKGYEKQIELIDENITTTISRIDLDKEKAYQVKVVEASNVIKTIEEKDYFDLINLGKQYIWERKNIAKKQLHGEKALCFESTD